MVQGSMKNLSKNKQKRKKKLATKKKILINWTTTTTKKHKFCSSNYNTKNIKMQAPGRDDVLQCLEMINDSFTKYILKYSKKKNKEEEPKTLFKVE